MKRILIIIFLVVSTGCVQTEQIGFQFRERESGKPIANEKVLVISGPGCRHSFLDPRHYFDHGPIQKEAVTNAEGTAIVEWPNEYLIYVIRFRGEHIEYFDLFDKDGSYAWHLMKTNNPYGNESTDSQNQKPSQFQIRKVFVSDSD